MTLDNKPDVPMFNDAVNVHNYSALREAVTSVGGGAIKIRYSFFFFTRPVLTDKSAAK